MCRALCALHFSSSRWIWWALGPILWTFAPVPTAFVIWFPLSIHHVCYLLTFRSLLRFSRVWKLLSALVLKDQKYILRKNVNFCFVALCIFILTPKNLSLFLTMKSPHKFLDKLLPRKRTQYKTWKETFTMKQLGPKFLHNNQSAFL